VLAFAPARPRQEKTTTKKKTTAEHAENSYYHTELFFFVPLAPFCGHFYLAPATLKSPSH
jgi:hypothetical protein